MKYLLDNKLTWGAKGLLSYLLSQSDDSEIFIENLKSRSKNGKDSTRNLMYELQENGYIQIEKTRDEKGRMKTNYILILE